MIKEGIFHPQLLRVLGELRHKDMLVIGDAGLPIPKGVERIDLGWIKGEPSYLKVLSEISKVMVIEGAIFANEAKEVSMDIHKEALSLLPETVKPEYVDHTQLKEITKDAKAIVLTGEFTGYTNVVLVCGCAY
ncbi:MAG: D-ribose pyranase [Lagierella massiliensis]|nr:D-ribose pyranase [Lagierella massiliensis]